MVIDLDKKDLAKYPFLKEAQNLVSSRAYSLDTLLNSNRGKIIANKAAKRVNDAISSDIRFDNLSLEFPEVEILSYAIARVIVSCMADRAVADRLARYEAKRADYFLKSEFPDKKRYVAASVGIDPDSNSIPVVNYVGLVSSLRDARWRLVNRDVRDGFVSVSSDDIDELIHERIRSILRDQLPFQVHSSICELLQPLVGKVSVAYQEKILEKFGQVEESAFPPCMQSIIQAVSAGTNIPHTARFALTAFLHTIGMDLTQIVEVYTRAPDFDVSKTMYQVEHISGRSGTEYTPPECATMRTYGLCVNQNAMCKTVNHPLTYYKKKKKEQGGNKQKST